MAAAAAGDLLTRAGASFSLIIGLSCCAPAVSEFVPPAPERAALGSLEDPAADLSVSLRRWESATRVRTDFARVPTSDVALGTDPYVLRRLNAPEGQEGEHRYVGILRGRSVLVELDSAFRELRRFPTPASPTGIAVAGNGDVFVVGELSSRVARFRSADGHRLEAAGSIELQGVLAMRDVAAGPEGVVYVVEEHDGRLVTFEPGVASSDSVPTARSDDVVCHGPVHVLRVAQSVLVDCLLDHQVVIRQVDRRGFPKSAGEIRIARDGPIWGIDALPQEKGLLLALGGAEDHPLDRAEGSFGFIDSFVALYSVANEVATKLHEVNVSAIGVVTPKALTLSRVPPGPLELVVAGYGSDRLAALDWADPIAREPPIMRTRAIPPGSAMIEGAADGSWRMANPLIDAWVQVTGNDVTIVPVDDELSRARRVDSKVGEALFFTTLIAPWNRSDGRLSRFTCETCHFEGYVDGRTHRTGRGDVIATTKPLVGLFNNRPHFSRAHDPDLTTMVNNEFRVAGARSDHDPWFSLSVDDVPWTRFLGVVGTRLAPETLRRSLMTFFMDFAPRPNPAVMGRGHWGNVERAGAIAFLNHCESCHQARLVADDASTRVAFERWENLVMTPGGPIVWADAEYEKTGVTPYVSDRGARVVSLRRLYKKYPYFTNGTAKDLRAVLDRARVADGRFFHDGAPESALGLSADEKSQLVAFLGLL